MPYKSSEIRWFSKEKAPLWEVFQSLPEEGPGLSEGDRIDCYLKTGLNSAGIKVREGNHEIKVKSDKDEKVNFGVFEHWVKWSQPEKEDLLEVVDKKFLKDWVRVEKKRLVKKYAIREHNKLEYTESGEIDDGCIVEFTELYLLDSSKIFFTLGFEAFGTENESKNNLYTTLNNLSIQYSDLEELDSCGYPEFLSGV